MKIEQNHPFIYFSIAPGAKSYLPLTDWEVEIYPTLLLIKQEKTGSLFKLTIDSQGPVDKFFTFLNLDKDCIQVEGVLPHNKFFRYVIQRQDSAIVIHFDKGLLLKDTHFKLNFDLDVQVKEKSILLPVDLPSFSSSKEVLLLGLHKKQDIDLMLRRNDLREIIPFYFRLAQVLPCIASHSMGLAHLLDRMGHHRRLKEKILLEQDLIHFISAGFSSFLFPDLYDDKHTGIEKKEKEHNIHADKMALLTKGLPLIRSLFLEQKGSSLTILPCLPISFIHGHCLDWVCEDKGLISFTWSNKHLKKMIFTSKQDFDLQLHLPHDIKEFRVRKNRQDKGMMIKAQDKISLLSNCTYFFDRFQK